MNIQIIGLGTSSVSTPAPINGTVSSSVMNAAENTGDASFVSVAQKNPIGNKDIDTLTVVASNIRFADNTMKRINGDLISKMKKELDTFVKQYPPYPQGSEERVKILKSYVGLRKQIEELTIPPDYHFARKILSDKSQVSDAGDQKVSIGKGSSSITIRNQAVSPGPEGLDIPSLSINSSDTEIYAAYDKVSKAESLIQNKREGLASDAKALARSIEFTHLPSDITEQEAHGQSSSVQRDLARTRMSIGTNQGLSSLL